MESTSIPLPGSLGRGVPKRLLRLRGDEQLVARIRDGDGAAFEVLYERYLPGILSFCRHMLGTREEAEDAVQIVFTSAYRELSTPGGDMRIKPWLYTVARNRCLSTLRARRETVDVEVETVSTAGLADSVERRADLRELLDDLRDLPEDQRAALVLTELGDLSHQEVGEVLGCETRKVKGLVFRARAGLAERREARGAACAEIREELATARRGALRRGRLRHHLQACPGCSSYLDEVRRQRRAMAAVLPVVPTLGLKNSVLAASGVAGAAGGAGTAAGGGLLASLAAAGPAATVGKVAVVGALVGSAGVAGEAALERGRGDRPRAHAPAAAPARGDLPAAVRGERGTGAAGAPGERSASGRRGIGRERAASRGRKTRRRASKSASGPREGVKGRVREPRGPGAAPGRTREPRVRQPPPTRKAPPSAERIPSSRSAPGEELEAIPAPVLPKGPKVED